jgi:predicted porin
MIDKIGPLTPIPKYKMIYKNFSSRNAVRYLGVLGASMCLCPFAWSQSSVSLYGAIDNGIDYNSNTKGQSQYETRSSVQLGSRLGFTGKEDLGDGLSTIFTIENGFDGFTGKAQQGGLLFGRQAFVGLTGPLGTLTFGRQYDASFIYLGALATTNQWSGYVGAHPGDYDNMNSSFRANSSVKYASPVWNGFSVATLYSLGGAAGSFVQNSLLTIGGGYSKGPLTINAAYLNAWNPATGVYGGATAPVTGSGWTSPITNPVYSGYTSANRLTLWGIGSQYTFGAATLAALYTYTSFDNLVYTVVTPHQGSVHFNNGELNFKYYVTPAVMAAVSYDYTLAPQAHYHQVNAAVNYFLSKRTWVYLLAVAQHASGTDSLGRPATAAITNLTPSSSNQQIFVRIGLVQKF